MKPGWYNDNANRAYPLLSGTEFAPDSAIVDAGFLLGVGSEFIAGDHSISLTEIRREGDDVIAVCTSDAPGLAGLSLEFVRTVTCLSADELDEPCFSQNEAAPIEGSVSSSLSEPENCPAAVWSGFLVWGPMQALLAALADAGGILNGTGIFEPALCRDLQQSYVRSLNLGNGDRTRYETADGCPAQVWPQEPQSLYLNEVCLQGRIRFREGYNCSIRQDTAAGTITIDGGVGSGAGEPCGEVPVYAGETAPDDSEVLEGGPRCPDVVRSINGVGGRVFELVGGTGVSVTPDPDTHTVVIDVDLHDLVVPS